LRIASILWSGDARKVGRSLERAAPPLPLHRGNGEEPYLAFTVLQKLLVSLPGNLNFSIPLLKVKGRGWTVTFNLSYNSQNWRQDSGGTWNWTVTADSATGEPARWPTPATHDLAFASTTTTHHLFSHHPPPN
jgi:hypothetical protein